MRGTFGGGAIGCCGPIGGGRVAVYREGVTLEAIVGIGWGVCDTVCDE